MNKILTIQLGQFKADLKKAGFSISKEKPTKMSDDQLLAELGL